jgi:hypothetical protein
MLVFTKFKKIQISILLFLYSSSWQCRVEYFIYLSWLCRSWLCKITVQGSSSGQKNRSIRSFGFKAVKFLKYSFHGFASSCLLMLFNWNANYPKHYKILKTSLFVVLMMIAFKVLPNNCEKHLKVCWLIGNLIFLNFQAASSQSLGAHSWKSWSTHHVNSSWTRKI